MVFNILKIIMFIITIGMLLGSIYASRDTCDKKANNIFSFILILNIVAIVS